MREGIGLTVRRAPWIGAAMIAASLSVDGDRTGRSLPDLSRFPAGRS